MMIHNVVLLTRGPLEVRSAKATTSALSAPLVAVRGGDFDAQTPSDAQTVEIAVNGDEGALPADAITLDLGGVKNLAGVAFKLDGAKIAEARDLREGKNKIALGGASLKKVKSTLSISVVPSGEATNESEASLRVEALEIGGKTLVFENPALKLAFLETQPFLKQRQVCHISTGVNNPRNSEGAMIRLANGDILHVYTRYYGNSSDDHATARLCSRRSTDGGETWTRKDLVELENEGRLNVMSVSLLRLANGEIMMTYLVKESVVDCIPYVRFSSDEGETWSERVRCIDGVSYNVVNNDRVIQLKNGAILIPVAEHPLKNPGKSNDVDWNAIVYCRYSTDDGRTWKSTGAVENPGVVFQEPGLVELADGSVLMNIRTNGGAQYYSRSTDGGMTWTKAVKSPLDAPLSPALLKRLPGSDKLLAVWNPYEPGWGRTMMDVGILSADGTVVEKRQRFALERWGWQYPEILYTDDGQVLIAFFNWERGIYVFKMEFTD
ncbi:MAG: exo-alpha-sialidase [Thermoguttaceae bacterium]|nr:exo-alpha-sialidase [Thermoguttaceae bacterium]